MWAIKLGEFDIEYLLRPSIKAQALTSFILECTIPDEEQNDGETTPMTNECWVLHIDGSSNAMGLGAGLMLTSSDGVVMEYALQFKFSTFNNKAEYEALVIDLRMAKKLRV